MAFIGASFSNSNILRLVVRVFLLQWSDIDRLNLTSVLDFIEDNLSDKITAIFFLCLYHREGGDNGPEVSKQGASSGKCGEGS